MDARSTYTSVLVAYYAGVAADLPIISPYARALAKSAIEAAFPEPALIQAFLTDPFLCAKLCGAANSMFFNHDHQPIYTLHESLQRVGFEYASELLREAPELPPGLSEDQLRIYWAHCMSVAYGAKRIAGASTRAHVGEEVAYLVGMVHDIGLLLQIHYSPHKITEVEKMLEAGEPASEAQCHSRHGEHLVRHWSLPSLAVAAIKCHHDPGSCEDQTGRWLSHVVALTEMLVETHSIEPSDIRVQPRFDDVIREVGVSSDELGNIKGEVMRVYEECMRLVVADPTSARPLASTFLRVVK